jgi:hypothetical protein
MFALKPGLRDFSERRTRYVGAGESALLTGPEFRRTISYSVHVYVLPMCSQLLCFQLFRQVRLGRLESCERSGNTGNTENTELYQSPAMFPVEDPFGNSGNKPRELRHRSRRRIWERSKPNLTAPALAPVKPYPQASALSLLQPSLRFVVSLRSHHGRFPSAGQLLPPNLAGQAGVALRNSQCDQERET